MRWSWNLVTVIAATIVSAPFPLHAETKPPAVTTTTVLDNLHNPCGVAVQPGSGHIFISESGAGQILRVQEDRSEPVIVGFPRAAFRAGQNDAGTNFDIGPLGLAFHGPDKLVVGGGGLPYGEDVIRVYAVPPAGPAVPADQRESERGTSKADQDSDAGDGNFYGVVVSDERIYATANGDHERGWIVRGRTSAREGDLERFIATKTATGVDGPTAITISPEGYLVVAQMGELDVSRDSVLAFFSPEDGKLLSVFETGLHDIAGLAYSPRSGSLYACDFGWGKNREDGGLFRLDAAVVDGKQVIKAVRILQLPMPTALAFAPNNALYITVLGAPEADSDKKAGKLVRVTGQL